MPQCQPNNFPSSDCGQLVGQADTTHFPGHSIELYNLIITPFPQPDSNSKAPRFSLEHSYSMATEVACWTRLASSEPEEYLIRQVIQRSLLKEQCDLSISQLDVSSLQGCDPKPWSFFCFQDVGFYRPSVCPEKHKGRFWGIIKSTLQLITYWT